MVKFFDLQKITMMHGDEYKEAVNRVIESGWFIQGNETKQFEADYAKYIGTDHCIAVANGLDALYLLMRGYKEMGIMQDGDEIIVPANTYIATIIAITRNNLVPVLVEPTWEHLEIDIDQIEQHISPKTKGVMIVHLYGRLAYNDKLGEICKKHGLRKFERNGYYGLQDEKGNIVVYPKYTDIQPFDEYRTGWAMVEIFGFKGFVDSAGQEVVHPQYDEIGKFGLYRDGCALVRKGNFYGFIDNTGKEVVPVKFPLQELTK